jgi:galactonate dehydratase
MDLNIIDIERFTVDLPFRTVSGRNMARELPHWSVFEICKVTLHSGAVGIGETMTYYTWGRVSDEAVKRAWGKNAHEAMWDDSLGSGLQMALFDAVGKALGVPIHALLGQKIRDRALLSWWAIDMPPDDWVSESQSAQKLGYTDFKTKGRPWQDVYAQMETLTAAMPPTFKVDLDFNDHLLDAERGIPVMQELERISPNFAICESPIPQGDVEGGKKIQQAVKVQIAHHYGSPPVPVQLGEDLCDGFVVSTSASRTLRQGAVAAEFDKPFWLQQVGSGITAAYSLHFAAVLSHATWPAVNCHQLFKRDLLATPIQVADGTAPIPDEPGLGLEIDEEALRRFRLPKPYDEQPNPPRLIETSWPNGAKTYFSTGNQMMGYGRSGNLPVCIRGVSTRLIPDDGTARWRDLHERALQAPVNEGEPGA